MIDSVIPPAPEGALPDRDQSKPAEQQGLFRKFVVSRTDGSDAPGGKHHGCRYFVLDVDHDQHASAALSAYATACEATHPALAKDLREKWGAPLPGPRPAPSVPEVTDAMAIAFHAALTDGGIGQQEVEEIKTGLRAALAAAPEAKP